MKYDAKCNDCKIIFEYERSIKQSGEPAPQCPQCKSQATEKVFSVNAGGFVLKGQGWFKKGGY
jgi:putative FmdB family regulatory protein